MQTGDVLEVLEVDPVTVPAPSLPEPTGERWADPTVAEEPERRGVLTG